MTWERSGDMPPVIRHTIVINTKEHPELAKWLWGLPWGSGASTMREILSDAVKMAMEKSAQSGVSMAPVAAAPAPVAAPAAIPAVAAAASEEKSSSASTSTDGVPSLDGRSISAEAAQRLAEMGGNF